MRYICVNYTRVEFLQCVGRNEIAVCDKRGHSARGTVDNGGQSAATIAAMGARDQWTSTSIVCLHKCAARANVRKQWVGLWEERRFIGGARSRRRNRQIRKQEL